MVWMFFLGWLAMPLGFAGVAGVIPCCLTELSSDEIETPNPALCQRKE
jgi:hypothetical protein